MPLTSDQLALQKHLEDLNSKTQAWVDEEAGRGASMYVTDPLFWADFAQVYSIADMIRYDLLTYAYELHKSKYGFKPNYGELKEMTNEELDKMIESLSAIPMMAESVDAYEW
jgi:hypothetical protein